jgi:hypothetical protein
VRESSCTIPHRSSLVISPTCPFSTPPHCGFSHLELRRGTSFFFKRGKPFSYRSDSSPSRLITRLARSFRVVLHRCCILIVVSLGRVSDTRPLTVEFQYLQGSCVGKPSVLRSKNAVLRTHTHTSFWPDNNTSPTHALIVYLLVLSATVLVTEILRFLQFFVVTA